MQSMSVIPSVFNATALLIFYTVQLLIFGGVLSGFMNQIEELATKQFNLKDNILVEESSLMLLSFKRLKKAFEPMLFIIIVAQTIVLTAMMFTFIRQLGQIDIINAVFSVGIYVLSALGGLIYTSVLADDAYGALKTLLPQLE